MLNSLSVLFSQECSICFDKGWDIKKPVVTKCNHLFCEKCINAWLPRDVSCPTCRGNPLPLDSKRFNLILEVKQGIKDTFWGAAIAGAGLLGEVVIAVDSKNTLKSIPRGSALGVAYAVLSVKMAAGFRSKGIDAVLAAVVSATAASIASLVTTGDTKALFFGGPLSFVGGGLLIGSLGATSVTELFYSGLAFTSIMQMGFAVGNGGGYAVGMSAVIGSGLLLSQPKESFAEANPKISKAIKIALSVMAVASSIYIGNKTYEVDITRDLALGAIWGFWGGVSGRNVRLIELAFEHIFE